MIYTTRINLNIYVEISVDLLFCSTDVIDVAAAGRHDPSSRSDMSLDKI